MHRAVYLATAVALASVVATNIAVGPISFALQALAIVLLVNAIRQTPREQRRRTLRELRLELILGAISCLGLLGMAVAGRFVPDEMRGPVGLLWLWLPLAFLGLLMVRIGTIVVTRVQRTKV